MANTSIRVEIKKHFGVISTNDLGWTKELNIVAWNGGKPKYDIREWSPDHARMSRGITFSDDEMDAVTRLYASRTKGDKE